MNDSFISLLERNDGSDANFISLEPLPRVLLLPCRPPTLAVTSMRESTAIGPRRRCFGLFSVAPMLTGDGVHMDDTGDMRTRGCDGETGVAESAGMNER